VNEAGPSHIAPTAISMMNPKLSPPSERVASPLESLTTLTARDEPTSQPRRRGGLHSSTKPLASLSLDLDNKWSYLKTHGDPTWQSYPSYLDVVVPRSLEMLRELNLKITYFVVGQDAEIAANHAALRSIADAGHEIGNHSFHHEPWLHRYSPDQLDAELRSAQDGIAAATGRRPVGFRGPGFSLSRQTLATLIDQGFQYDASTLPTFIGPLARLYYFWTSRLDKQQKEERKILFGTMRDGLRPLRSYYWRVGDDRILEIPVTTIPLVRSPFHVSYLLFLLRYSKGLALSYFRWALRLCRLRGVQPSLLLHPLDFLGAEDDADLAFFPAMDLGAERKCEFLREVLTIYRRQFDVVTMQDHAARLRENGDRLRTWSADDLAG
jgi:hypothetical protein